MLMLSAQLQVLLKDASRTGQLSHDRLSQLLAAHPGKAMVLHVSGLWALSQKDGRRAASLLRQAVEIEDKNAALHNNYGIALRDTNQRSMALKFFRSAIFLAPDAYQAFFNLGATLLSMDDIEAASENLYQALQLSPNSSEIRQQLAEVHIMQGQLAAAESLVQAAFDDDPDSVDNNMSMGKLAIAQRQWQRAGEYFDTVLEHQANHLAALCSLAELGEDNRLEELWETLLAARHCVTDTESQFQLAFALSHIAKLRRDVKAEMHYLRRALHYRPDDVKARVNYAKLLLLMGDYSAGWAEFEWRWKQPATILSSRGLIVRRWLGEPLNDEPILLHAEQGFGDVLQFVRYVPMVAKRGGRVILEVPQSLARLMESLKGVEKIIVTGDPVPSVDWQCPLMSLPLAFGTTIDTIPADIPYLIAPEADKWSLPLAKSGSRVGIVWAGSRTHANDRRRSMPVEALLPLKEVQGLALYSLQQHNDSNTVTDSLAFIRKDFENSLIDYATTAAIIANLDIVISVCTSVAHLAGALGKEVWVMLPFAGEYRWLLDREDSPWYPTMKIFRQSRPGDWSGVVKKIVEALQLRASRVCLT